MQVNVEDIRSGVQALAQALMGGESSSPGRKLSSRRSTAGVMGFSPSADRHSWSSVLPGSGRKLPAPIDASGCGTSHGLAGQKPAASDGSAVLVLRTCTLRTTSVTTARLLGDGEASGSSTAPSAVAAGPPLASGMLQQHTRSMYALGTPALAPMQHGSSTAPDAGTSSASLGSTPSATVKAAHREPVSTAAVMQPHTVPCAQGPADASLQLVATLAAQPASAMSAAATLHEEFAAYRARADARVAGLEAQVELLRTALQTRPHDMAATAATNPREVDATVTDAESRCTSAASGTCTADSMEAAGSDGSSDTVGGFGGMIPPGAAELPEHHPQAAAALASTAINSSGAMTTDTVAITNSSIGDASVDDACVDDASVDDDQVSGVDNILHQVLADGEGEPVLLQETHGPFVIRSFVGDSRGSGPPMLTAASPPPVVIVQAPLGSGHAHAIIRSTLYAHVPAAASASADHVPVAQPSAAASQPAVPLVGPHPSARDAPHGYAGAAAGAATSGRGSVGRHAVARRHSLDPQPRRAAVAFGGTLSPGRAGERPLAHTAGQQ